MWIPQQLKRVSDRQAKSTQYLAEIAAGTDRQQQLLNDKLTEVIVALNDVSKVLRSKLDAVVSRLDSNAKLVSDKLDAVIAGLGSKALLAPAERDKILRDWNNTARPTPSATLPQLFEAHVEKTPDAVAVVFEDQSLTYAELNGRANQLAHHLQRLGVGPEIVVGLCVERSLEMIIGLIGILKAGGAYLPLDPSYPQERLAFMLSDARASLLVTQAALIERRPLHHAPILHLDRDWPAIAQNPTTAPANSLHPENLAYVIYTSGSTGIPKGVCVTHQSLSNLSAAQMQDFPMQPGDRVLGNASISFDISIEQKLLPLLHGASVVLPDDIEVLSPPAFWDFVSRKAVNYLDTTPSLLAAVIEAAPPVQPINRVVLGGEETLPFLVLRLRERLGDVPITNTYGPTECCIDATALDLVAIDTETRIPIGRPLANYRAYVLNAGLEAVPVGVAGELYIAGAGLARGYLQRPGLTAERFVVDPFGPAGGRMFRTGDLVRWRADGVLDFLGRTDQQIKIRGFRVEPGEIEATLGHHPAVAQCAVMAREDTPGNKWLVAYLVPVAGQSADPCALRAHLGQSLPHYMVPSAFVSLRQLPLTSNGKLDRSALPLPLSLDHSADVRQTREISATEARLLALCREILACYGLAVDERLLDAGFHSLAFAQLAWRIHKEFGVSLAFSEMFARRTVAELASLVDARIASGNGGLEPLKAVEREGCLPLSLAQERVWFLEQLHPRNIAYNFQSILRFHGRLDIPALEKSLNLLVHRHEILRTSFPQSGGRPYRYIHPFASFTLSVEDVESSEVEQRIAQVVREPFDLALSPPVRWILFRLTQEDHWLLHMEHHLLHDGWGYGVFLEELFECYDSFAANRNPALRPLTVQFTDFAVWQRQQLASGRWEGQLDYWQKRLRAPPPAAQLPSDRPRSSVQTFAGAEFRQPLDREFYAQLLAASAREGVTPYMWLHAAFQAFLFRYTGQTDIIVGSGVANRQSAEAQRLLGMIINTVAIRMSFSGQPSFREILSRARMAILEAMDNQDAPFDHVVQRVGPGTALFNTFFDAYDKAFPSYHNDVLRVEHRDGISNGTCKFDIVALVMPIDGNPTTLIWEYNKDLFTEETASRMMRHFLALLAESVANPGLPVALLPMLSAQERKGIIAVCTGKSTCSPRHGRLDEIFAAVAAAHSDAVAVVCPDERLSYRELNQRAVQLADQLRAIGTRPGDVVAFSLPRGPQALSAMLAILSCGCVYLPLDPRLPKARQDILLRTAGAGLLVTGEGIARLELEGPQVPADPLLERAAYVLFTSGSTGSPKAVCVPHRAVARLVCDVEYVHLKSDTRFLQLAPLSFDASTLEIWGPLLNGGTVVVHPEDLPDFAGLGLTIASQHVTTAWLTASLFNQIIDTAPEILRPLRELLTGGEALSAPHVVRALAALPSTTLINGYGPTEATTFTTTFTIPRDFDSSSQRVPIGRPLPDTQIYVLDEHRQLLPIGVPGEIFIGGDGLALGYRGDHGLTAEKFVSDSVGGRPGARLYRTGDRGRLLSDGTLDFIERLDDQVKIRGFRIEPGEIESALSRCEHVLEAVVVPREDTPGDKQLVAYIVSKAQTKPCVGELRAQLQASLPEYMVPAAYVFLDALPLTPNGKVDRLALARPEGVEREQEPPPPGTSARTPLEEVLVGIWANTLKLKRVGVHDNFFDLGGHSLLALQIIHEMNSAFGLKLSVRLLFTAPTVAGQAREIERARATANNEPRPPHPTLVPLRACGSRPPFFLVAGGFGSEADLIVYAGLARYLDRRRPFYGLRIRGVDDVVEPHGTVEAMAAEHVAEIRKVQPHGPYFIGGSCIGGVVAFEIAQQLRVQGEAIGSLILVDSVFPTGWSWLLRFLFRYFWLQHGLPFARSYRQNPAVFRAALKEKVTALINPSPEQRLGRKRFRIALKYLRRTLRYAPRPYPGPVTLILAEKQRMVDPTRVWRDVAGGGLNIQQVPGDHSSHLRVPEHASLTAAELDACLQAASDRLQNGAGLMVSAGMSIVPGRVVVPAPIATE